MPINFEELSKQISPGTESIEYRYLKNVLAILKKDKKIEIDRYDQRAVQVLNFKKNSKKKIKDYINVPYQYYFSLLKKLKAVLIQKALYHW